MRGPREGAVSEPLWDCLLTFALGSVWERLASWERPRGCVFSVFLFRGDERARSAERGGGHRTDCHQERIDPPPPLDVKLNGSPLS